MMDWTRLLSAKRLRTDKRDEDGDGRTPFERDLDRIVFSSAFRRLQDKTQVHPLTENDHVRTRLTHSIEVASVGRSLGKIVGTRLSRDFGVDPYHVSAVVQAACLTHDIGNPPFGHLGEEAIGHFFTHDPMAPEVLDGLTPAQKRDLQCFEGNAQGFRILTQTEMKKGRGGLRLTCAMLGAFTKYPRGVDLAAPPAEDVAAKKHGFHQAEAGYFEEVAEECGLIRHRPGQAFWCRHPLAFLMEAADDICYAVIDLEDGYEIGCLEFARLERQLLELARLDTGTTDYYAALPAPTDKIGFLRARIIGALIDEATKAFFHHQEDFLRGAVRRSLIDLTSLAAQVKEAKKLAKAEIYDSKNVIRAEIAGFDVLNGLLRELCTALLDLERHGEIARTPAKSRLLLTLFGDKLKGAEGRYDRLLRITDHISGMTDHYAVHLYRRIKGIEF